MSSEGDVTALVKDALGLAALHAIADAGAAASPDFDCDGFLIAASTGLEALSILERVRHIADALGRALPADYTAALATVRRIAPRLTRGFQVVAVTEYVARFGLEAFDESLAAIADLTRYGTGEFAVRPFLAADVARTLAHMERWARDEDEHLRRLASEGSRPRLPWAARIPTLKEDPTLAAPILEILKADRSAYVRKSVANHLNDIGKERPDWVIERLAGWSQEDAATRWIVRHALRTLIKQGNVRALALIGAGEAPAVEVTGFLVEPAVAMLGESIRVEAILVSSGKSTQKLVVDYRIHYVRASGRASSKVFKMKTFDLAPHAKATVSARQIIRNFSTRRHYPGVHRLDLLVNGAVLAETGFDLVNESGK